MTQKRLIELALAGAKAKQIAMWDGIMKWEKEKPHVAETLKKVLADTVDEIRELEAMLEKEVQNNG